VIEVELWYYSSMKTLRIFLLVLIIIGIGLLVTQKTWVPKLVDRILKSENVNIQAPLPEVVTKEPISMCYSYLKKSSRGFFDRVYLRLKIDGSNVSGEYNNYLAEKDSKVGTFTGTVGPLDQRMMGRRADVWWNTIGEGMKVTEELIIDFGDGSAVTAGGEMVDRGDGVCVYKDKTKLSFNGLSLGQISCEDLDEINIVEKYVRDNIKTIAPDKPVLGGAWNVMDINIVPATKSGEVVYEDGHIQSRVSFQYEFNSNTKSILIKFENKNKD